MGKILYQLSNGERLFYYKNALYLQNELIVNFAPYLSTYKQVLSKYRLFNRLFRLEPRIATFVNDDICILSFLQKLFFISISEQKIIAIEPVRPSFGNILNFCSLKTYGSDEVYWGDYGPNQSLDFINIYRYSPLKGVHVCYTFQPGMVKHIHHILYDYYRDQFFIFTGDFGADVGVYIASRDFSTVYPFLVGNEQYRAVVGCVTETGLIWATDAVMEDNFLYYMDFQKKTIIKLAQLNGSVIYGTKVAHGMVFSTTVESYPSKKSKFLTLLDNRLGPGIKSKMVDVIFVTNQLVVHKIAEFKKDWLPMRLFQYGFVSFPYFENIENTELVCNPMAVKKWDDKVFSLNLERYI